MPCWRRGSWAARRACDRRCGDRTGLPERPHTGDLATCRRADPNFLRRAPGGRPADRRTNTPASISTSRTSPYFPLASGSPMAGSSFWTCAFRPAPFATGRWPFSWMSSIMGRAKRRKRCSYLTSKIASVSRPNSSQGFRQDSTQTGREGTVTISLPVADLSFLGTDRAGIRAGRGGDLAGPCADRAQLLTALVQFQWPPAPARAWFGTFCRSARAASDFSDRGGIYGAKIVSVRCAAARMAILQRVDSWMRRQSIGRGAPAPSPANRIAPR